VTRSGAVNIATDELRDALEQALRDSSDPRRVASLDRSPCAFTSSFTLEELAVALDDGTQLDLMFKDLGTSGLSERARAAKPDFLYDPLREIEAYRSILAPADLGTAAFYGSVVDPAHGRFWLFIENVPGTALWQIGELEVWEAVARWTAKLHGRFAGEEVRGAETLVRYDADLFRLWMRRALDFADRWEAQQPGKGRRTIEWLAERYEPVVERLAALPTTFIHGELYASNVLVEQRDGETRVCPIDWELAAIGPGLIDLAALTMGWDAEERGALTTAYRARVQAGGEAGGPMDGGLTDGEPFGELLDCARLHLAVQWLGWAPDWRPPRSHRRNWVDEALTIAGELGL
jgi:phosphotransferase family enzyme